MSDCNSTDKIHIKKTILGEEIDVLYFPSPAPLKEGDDAGASILMGGGDMTIPPLRPRSYIENGMEIMQDVPVKVRDGSTLYIDVYRTAGTNLPLPVVLSWSMYGKRPAEMVKEWRIFGVPTDTVSQYAKFESADPMFWCSMGYAVVNADSRGCGRSDGNMPIWGEEDARDGYDLIEWLSEQSWCNGKIGMFGNSGVAMTQWWVASLQPPHLTCIAPWEGTSDLYREFICEGGIPSMGFINFVMSALRSQQYIEDLAGMLAEHPLMDAYWESKIPDFKKIKIPAYVCGGWSHLHLRGSVNGWRKIRSQKKWLRLHREFEWPDAYAYDNLMDLKKFFDRYLKDIHNGWEQTPRVRMEVMDAYDYDFQINRPENEFPIARTEYKKLYLNATNASLEEENSTQEMSCSYDSINGETVFDIKFKEDIEISGYFKAHLYVSSDSHNDMDMFFTVQKLDENGNWLPTSVLGEEHPGAWGKIRVSHRELDPDLSTDFQPVMAHKSEKKLNAGEIVPIDVEFYPHSRFWHKGQQLRLRIAGRYIREGWFEPFSWETDNKGEHIIHTGGKYDSYLQIPVIPPKYKAGDYIYR